VPAAYQHRVLFWGVLGAIVLRGAFIGLGAAMLETFHWTIYLFGGLLVLTGLRMLFHKCEDINPERNPVLRLTRRLVPMSERYEGQRLFARVDGRWKATPLFAVLVTVETTDLIFAVDSIPAIFAVTSDPFLVFTSNAFAILGLRALYFLLAGMIGRFTYLKLGLGVILIGVGLKMLASDLYKVPIWLSLGAIALILAASILPSLLPRQDSSGQPGGPAH
jgi:tellurite resistance protein TerC